jgi:hypothetical protein
MNTVSRFARLVVAALILWTGGCSRTDIFGPSGDTPVSGPRPIKVSPATVTLGTGRSVQFTAQATPSQADDKFEWTVTSSTGGAVTSAGIFTAPAELAAGTTNLTAIIQAKLVGEGSTAQARVTIVPQAGPPPARLVKLSGDSQTGVVGTPLPAPFVVQALDANNAPVSGIAVHFASPFSAMAAVDAITGADGRANGQPQAGPVAGGQVFIATSPSTNPVAFFATLSPGPFVRIVATHPAPTGLFDTTLPDPVSVSFRDQYGNPLPGRSAVASTTGGGTATPTSMVSNANGVQFFTIHLGGTIGVQDFLFTDAQNPAISAKLTFTVSGGLASKVIIVSGDQQPGTVGQALAQPLTIEVVDAAGRGVPGVMITWSTPDGGSFDQVSMVTDGNGQATATAKVGSKAGLQRFVADAGRITNSPLAFLEQAQAGAATQLLLAGGAGQSTGAGAPYGAAFSVLAADQFGNPVAGVPVHFEVVSGGGSISPTDVLSGADGLAQAKMIAGATGGRQVYRASSSAVMAPQVDLTLQSAAPVVFQVDVVSGNNQSGQTGTSLAAPLVVKVSLGGMPASGQTVTFGVTVGGGAVQPVTVVTGMDGLAQTSAQLGTQPGLVRFSATVPGATNSPVFFDATAVGQVVAGLKIVSGAGQTGPVNSQLPQLLVVVALDANGMPVANVPITFTPAANSQVGTPTTRTDGQGQASTTAILGPAAGDQFFVATSGSASATFRETAVQLNEHLKIVSGDGQTAEIGSPLPQPLVVQLTDDNGAPLAGIEVDWSSLSPGGALSSLIARTDAQGLAQVTAQLGSTAGMQSFTAAVTGAQNSPVTFTEVATAAPAAQLVLVSGDMQTGPPSSMLAAPLVVKVVDKFGNGVAGFTVTFSVGTGGGVLSATSATTGADGTASVMVTLGPAAETETFSVTASGLAGSPVTFTETSSSLTLDHISISPAGQMLGVGGSVSYTAVAVFKDGTTSIITDQATWSSSDPMTASVSDQAGAKGVTIAQATGTATITAAYGGITGTTTVTVTGAAQITAISITPAGATIIQGTSLQFHATATYSDSSIADVTESATWTSSDITIASTSDAAGSKGLTQGVAVGTATLKATLMGVTGSRSVTVSQSNVAQLEITPATVAQPAGTSVNFHATVTLKDGTVEDVTSQVVWSSSDGTQLTVLNAPDPAAGRAALVAAGSPTLTATLMTGETASIVVKITSATLKALSVSPANQRLAVNDTYQFTVSATYSDGTVHDVTSSVAWSSSDPTIVDVSNAPGSQGSVTALAQGQITLTATLGGTQGTATVIVDNAQVVILRIFQRTGGFPNFNKSFTCEPGTSVAIHAGVAYQGGGGGGPGRLADVSDQANWSSSDPSIAVVGQGPVSGGVVQCIKSGSVTITAAYQGNSDTATVTVTNATLTSIALVPTSAALHIGDIQSFHAEGTYSDGQMRDITDTATWMSADSTVASASNATGNRGVVTGIGPGMTTVTASYQGVTAQAAVSVTNARLKLVLVTPTNPSVAQRQRRFTFSATALYDDNSQQNVTTQATWSSSDASVADVETGANIGTARLMGTGSCQISATYQGLTGTTTLTVF